MDFSKIFYLQSNIDQFANPNNYIFSKPSVLSTQYEHIIDYYMSIICSYFVESSECLDNQYILVILTCTLNKL